MALEVSCQWFHAGWATKAIMQELVEIRNKFSKVGHPDTEIARTKVIYSLGWRGDYD